VLVEAHDDWHVADKRYLSEATLALLKAGGPGNKLTESVAPTAALTAQ